MTKLFSYPMKKISCLNSAYSYIIYIIASSTNENKIKIKMTDITIHLK